MCSTPTAGNGSIPYIFTGGSVPSAPGNTPTCLPTVFASNYNSSLCQPSVTCLGLSGTRKRRHKNRYAPVYIATNWWKSGDSQGTARCIDDDDTFYVETISKNINNGPLLPTTKTSDIISRLESILSSL